MQSMSLAPLRWIASQFTSSVSRPSHVSSLLNFPPVSSSLPSRFTSLLKFGVLALDRISVPARTYRKRRRASRMPWP